jgi:hypothetical protein
MHDGIGKPRAANDLDGPAWEGSNLAWPAWDGNPTPFGVGRAGYRWEGVNLGWHPDPRGVGDDPAAIAGVGKLWVGPQHLADVYYELVGTRDVGFATRAPVMRYAEGG